MNIHKFNEYEEVEKELNVIQGNYRPHIPISLYIKESKTENE